MSTTDRVRVCADCGASEAPAATWEAPPAEPGPASGLGTCPKCQKGQLAVRSGAYGTFVSCSDRCGLTYTSDAEGVPAGGRCKACQGPVKKTQSGSRICAVCGVWQEDKAVAAPGQAARPTKPKAALCPRCSQPLKEVFTKREKWVYRCDPCKEWLEVPTAGGRSPA
jgi:ssDNA-binding Zn-finger/Zn-ribbon topoisomerase 1